MTGQEWGELRVPEEVFAPTSLASLKGAPVTEDHQGMVTADTWKTVSRGHVCEDVHPDDTFVAATVAIEDADTVRKVEAGELVEVSCGYTCDLDPTAGVHDGIPYRAIQRNIQYNHLALGPRGWGRAGADVSLRMDGAAVEVVPTVPAKDNSMKRTIKLGGKAYRLDADEEVSAFDAALTALQAKADELGPANAALTGEIAALKEALGAALAKLAELEAKMGGHAEPDGDEAKPAVDAEGEDKPAPDAKPAPGDKPAPTEEEVPEAVKDSIAEKRIALWDQARKVLGPKATLKGKSTRAIHEACIAARLPAVKCDSLTADTLAGMFMALTAVPAPNAALGAAHADAVGVTVVHNDANNEPDADAALAKMRAESANAWKRPLKPGARS